MKPIASPLPAAATMLLAALAGFGTAVPIAWAGEKAETVPIGLPASESLKPALGFTSGRYSLNPEHLIFRRGTREDLGGEDRSWQGDGQPSGTDRYFARVLVDRREGDEPDATLRFKVESLPDRESYEFCYCPLHETSNAGYWARGLVKAYRESDGSHLGSREIDTGSSGNDLPRGLWSDGTTLWVADEVDLKLYAYAVAVSVAASQGSVDPGPFGPIPTSWTPAVPSASPGPPVFNPDAGLRSRFEAALGKAPGESIGTREMAAIETLNLDGAAPDLWALIGLAGLKRMSLRGNGLEDISALSLLAGLRVLDIGENRITDLSPLAALTGLESLRADGNRIRDLAPLAGLTSLRHLSLSDNAITDPLPGE